MEPLFYQSVRFEKRARDAFKSCWIMKSSPEDRQEVPDLLIPDGCPELIWVFKGAYRKVSLADPARAREIDSSCLVGIQNDTQLVTRLGAVHLVGLKLKPAGFARLFPSWPAAAAGQNVPLQQLGMPWLDTLTEELRKCTDAEEVRSTLGHHLAGMPPADEKLQTVARSIEALIAAKGDLSVRELAEGQHRSVRQLQRYFKQYVGIPPKQFAGIIRFKALYKDSVARQVLPRDYYQYGYFDQNHFIKDFKAHLGVTPREARGRRFQQQNKIARISRG